MPPPVFMVVITSIVCSEYHTYDHLANEQVEYYLIWEGGFDLLCYDGVRSQS